MKHIVIFCLVCSLIAVFAIGVQGQDKAVSNSRKDNRLKVLGFSRPFTCGLEVSGNKSRKYPTVFCLDAIKVGSTRIDPIFYEIAKSWLASHPDAAVVEIFTEPVFPTGRRRDGVAEYVWVIAGSENLNIKLVEAGACEAQTMILEPDDESDVLIDNAVYDKFKREVLEAEVFAKEHRLGIWK